MHMIKEERAGSEARRGAAFEMRPEGSTGQKRGWGQARLTCGSLHTSVEQRGGRMQGGRRTVVGARGWGWATQPWGLRERPGRLRDLILWLLCEEWLGGGPSRDPMWSNSGSYPSRLARAHSSLVGGQESVREHLGPCSETT